MSENVTFPTMGDYAGEIFDEENDYNHAEHVAPYIIMDYFELYYTTLVLLIGVPCNILALLLLIRRRLWNQHEAYVYLAAILIINTVKLVFDHSNRSMELLDHSLLRISLTDDFVCRIREWFLYMTLYMNWLHVLMLLNVYLRQQLITSRDRTGCYMNLAAKYCTLFGTKVVISSFFTFCALVNFWSFSLSTLRHFTDRPTWYCTISLLYPWDQYYLLAEASWWLGIDISLILVIPLLLLVVWKIKRSSGFTFSQMNGDSKNNGDVEVLVRIVLLCAAIFFVLNAPLSIVYALYTLTSYNHMHLHIGYVAVHLIAVANPLSAPIVCFAVKSRIREDLKAIVVRCCCRCCPGAICQTTLSPEPDSNDTVVQGMVQIEDDSPNI